MSETPNNGPCFPCPPCPRAGGLDFSSPVKKFFYDPLGSGRAFVNCAVSLTGFALVGGPARQDAPKVGGRAGLGRRRLKQILESCVASGLGA